MAFKRRAEPATTIEDEHAALRAQHAALEDLKRQLSERVEAVRERELELHHALAEANSQSPGKGAGNDGAGDTQRREQAVAQRERAVAAAEAELAARSRQLELDPADAVTMVGAPAPAIEAPTEPDAERLAQIEARLAELRDAEKLFLRTRAELAARSEAVAARERLVAQKERELDDREDGVGQWASPGLTEMEARLRRLEQQQDPSEQTIGFSGGLRKLQQGTTRPQRDD
jgi:hypothetical protein